MIPPNSLTAVEIALSEAMDGQTSARNATTLLAVKALAMRLRADYPHASLLELTEGDQSAHDVTFLALKTADEINIDVDDNEGFSLDDECQDLIMAIEDYHLAELIGIVRTRINGRTPIWIVDLVLAAEILVAQPTATATPQVELLVVRDPDGGTYTAVFIDGVKVEHVIDYTLDPGVGLQWSDWADDRDAELAVASSEAVRTALTNAYADPPGQQYIEGKPDSVGWLAPVGTCKHCREHVSQDDRGSWVDTTDGDACTGNDDAGQSGVHEISEEEDE